MPPFQLEFYCRERVDIAWAQVRLVGRVGNSGHVSFKILVKNSLTMSEVCAGALSFIVIVISIHPLECVDITL
jgi:hypothetical protein